MKSTYLGRSCRSLELFQLHPADAVLAAPLPTHSRNIDLETTAEAFYRGS